MRAAHHTCGIPRVPPRHICIPARRKTPILGMPRAVIHHTGAESESVAPPAARSVLRARLPLISESSPPSPPPPPTRSERAVPFLFRTKRWLTPATFHIPPLGSCSYADTRPSQAPRTFAPSICWRTPFAAGWTRGTWRRCSSWSPTATTPTRIRTLTPCPLPGGEAATPVPAAATGAAPAPCPPPPAPRKPSPPPTFAGQQGGRAGRRSRQGDGQTGEEAREKEGGEAEEAVAAVAEPRRVVR